MVGRSLSGVCCKSSSSFRSESGMEANAGLVAGSHNRNELVVIRRERDGDSAVIVLFCFATVV